MTAVWMGLATLADETASGCVTLDGDKALARSMQRWLGLGVSPRLVERPAQRDPGEEDRLRVSELHRQIMALTQDRDAALEVGSAGEIDADDVRHLLSSLRDPLSSGSEETTAEADATDTGRAAYSSASPSPARGASSPPEHRWRASTSAA